MIICMYIYTHMKTTQQINNQNKHQQQIQRRQRRQTNNNMIQMETGVCDGRSRCEGFDTGAMVYQAGPPLGHYDYYEHD